MALLRVRDDPHLVVVAIFRHNHGDGAGVTFARQGRCACRPRVSLCHFREATLPVAGCPAFSCRQACVRWHAEGFGSLWWGARSRPPVLGAGLGSVGGAMSVCAQPRCGTHTPPLGWQVGVEPPDPCFCKVVRDLCPGGDERLELPHKDSGCSGVQQAEPATSLFMLLSRRCSRRAATSWLEGLVAWMP